MISRCRRFWYHQPLLAALRACFLNVGGDAVPFDETARQIFKPNGRCEVIGGAIGVARIIAGAPGLGDSAYAVRGAFSTASLKSLANVLSVARIGQLCFSDWRDGRHMAEAFAA